MTERADKLIYKKGLAKSRSAAQALINEKKVLCRGRLVLKPSELLEEDDEITVTEPPRYVSRGGLKLEHALSVFGVSVADDVCADIGASTGGFTDCLLRHGAKKVFAIEGGHGQLDPSLSDDLRVISIEDFNAKELCFETVGEMCDTVVMDVSFISQTLLHKNVAEILKPGGKFITLIKPQFEAGKNNIGKGGIAKKECYPEVKAKVCTSAGNNGLKLSSGIEESSIKGGDGNTEFLALFIKE